jgi:hypothetical protein
MLTIENVRELALSLPEAEEQDHFGRPSFRIRNKIFATLWPKEKKAMIKLSLVDQSVFCDLDKSIFYPVPGGWGLKGSTFVELNKVSGKIFKEALLSAWRQVAPQTLVKKYTEDK